MYSHVVSDFGVLNVFQNSHTTKPLLYKVSGTWGNHEGSMLLWILVLTIFNYFIFKLYNQINSTFISKALETQAFIILVFYYSLYLLLIPSKEFYQHNQMVWVLIQFYKIQLWRSTHHYYISVM